MAGLDDFLNLLGDRRVGGRMGPSLSLEQLQEDIDPETGAYNSPYLDTVTGQPIDPTLFGDQIDAAGLADTLPAPAITEVARPTWDTGIAFGPASEGPGRGAEQDASMPYQPDLPSGLAPNTGSVRVGASPNQRDYGPATLREDQIQGPGRGAEQDATISDDRGGLLEQILSMLQRSRSPRNPQDLYPRLGSGQTPRPNYYRR